MAYTDLGGLGSKQGSPVLYDWVAPSLIPQFLPWLAILALLMLKPNRCASALWIWVPLACVGGITCAPESVLESLPGSQIGIFLELISAMGFGLAAVWLLSSYLGWKHRVLAFLGIMLAQGVFSSLAYVIRLGREGIDVETLGMGVFLAVGVLVISLALILAGLLCRGHYSCLRLSLWLIAALAVLWALIFGPVFIIARMVSGADVPVMAGFAFAAMAAGISFGVLLPFLVLSFANGFYRERLKGLLHLGDVFAPPVIASPPPAVPEPAVGQGGAA